MYVVYKSSIEKNGNKYVYLNFYTSGVGIKMSN